MVLLDALHGVLHRADAVFSAVDSQAPVVTLEAHRPHLKPEGVLMVDLGMPRNIDPAFDTCGGGVSVADLDVLKQWYRTVNGTLEQVLEVCSTVMADHREIYERIRRSVQGDGSSNEI